MQLQPSASFLQVSFKATDSVVRLPERVSAGAVVGACGATVGAAARLSLVEVLDLFCNKFCFILAEEQLTSVPFL